MTRFNNHDFQNILPNSTKKYLFPTISRKLTPFLWTKPQNTCMEAEARSRNCFQENLKSASALASASISASTSMVSDKFNKIINEEKHYVLNFFTGFDNYFQNSLQNPTQKYIFSNNIKRINSISLDKASKYMEAEAGSRSGSSFFKLFPLLLPAKKAWVSKFENTISDSKVS